MVEEYNFTCLSNVDMEPSRNIMGCRDISGIQNSLQLKLEVKKWFLKSIFLLSESVNLNIDRLGNNMMQEATRSTISSRTLLDHFVTTKRDLISSSGVFPLGLSDHDLIYATIRLKNKRPSPKIIKTRNYKRMNVEKFKHDLEHTPFHIASIFEEPDDQLWVWE